jgi:hypothetical protein
VRDNDPCFSLIDQGWRGPIIDGDDNQQEKMECSLLSVISYILADTIVGLVKKLDFTKTWTCSR